MTRPQIPPLLPARPLAPRRFERFFAQFWEYDTIVVATFPTCHAEVMRELVALRLPQRYMAVVHNPGVCVNEGCVCVRACVCVAGDWEGKWDANHAC